MAASDRLTRHTCESQRWWQHMQDLPQCGSNLAATDAVLTVQALLATEPAPDAVITAASKAAAVAVITKFLEAAGLQALLKVCVPCLRILPNT